MSDSKLPQKKQASPGIDPDAARWWLYLRITLEKMRVRKLSDNQWATALDIAKTRHLKPEEAAQIIAESA